MRWVRMVVEGVRRCECDGRHPILTLIESGGDRWLNVRVTGHEADHLAHELAGRPSRTSVTYGLIEELLSALGWSLTAVRLGGTPHQELLGLVEVTHGDQRAGVRAHPSDAVLLATRREITIDVPLELARVGERGLAAPWLAGDDVDEVAAFRRLLDDVTPEDFAP
jgi:bifunctional DNase/RNase